MRRHLMTLAAFLGLSALSGHRYPALKKCRNPNRVRLAERSVSAKDEPGALEFGHTSRHSIYGWQTVMSEGGAAIRRSRFVQDVGYLCPDNALRPIFPKT